MTERRKYSIEELAILKEVRSTGLSSTPDSIHTSDKHSFTDNIELFLIWLQKMEDQGKIDHLIYFYNKKNMIESSIKKKILQLYPGQPRTPVNEFRQDPGEMIIVKPMEYLEDNEIVEIARIIFDLKGYEDAWDEVEVIKNDVLKLYENDVWSPAHQGISFAKCLQISDYLRDRGYAIPAHGYTIEQLVKNDVFKMLERDTKTRPVNAQPVYENDKRGKTGPDSGTMRKKTQSKSLDDLLNRGKK